MNNVDANNPDAITACGIRGRERKEDMTRKEIAIQVISVLTSNNVSISESGKGIRKKYGFYSVNIPTLLMPLIA